jgi:hypothetical protein
VEFRRPKCRRRANPLWLIEDRPHCVKCCNGLNIWHRTKWGFGRRERLKAKDRVLDELIAKLETTVALRFNPARPNIGAAKRSSSPIAEASLAASGAASSLAG